MIGNDRKLIELNMKKFILKFLKESEKMHQVEHLCLLTDLAKDIRSIT